MIYVGGQGSIDRGCIGRPNLVSAYADMDKRLLERHPLVKQDGVLMIREQLQSGREVSGSRWARFSLRDIAALRVVIELAGGRAAMQPGRRLQLAAIQRACAALLAAGITEPLLEVPLARQGKAVYAMINGSIIDPTNGKTVLQETYESAAAWLTAREAALLDRLREERDRNVIHVESRELGQQQVSR
jgi:hypothetical protein